MGKNTKKRIKHISSKPKPKVINTKKYVEYALKIKTKEGEIKPLIYNKAQMKLYNVIKSQYEAGKPGRVIVLKARQLGISTGTGSIIFKNISTKKNRKAAIVAHKDDATRNLFNMYKLYYERLPEPLQPQIKSYNGYAIEYDTPEGEGLKSSVECHTAGGKGVGRSATYQYLHLSEYAFWPGQKQDTLLGLMQAVPRIKDSLIVIESTANGFEHFKELWDRAVAGKSGFYPLFIAWFEMPEYSSPAPAGFEPQAQGDYGDEVAEQKQYNLTNDQLWWRRWCIDDYCNGDLNKFRQEYPGNPEEAFIASGSSVFNNEIIIRQLERARHIKPIKTGYFEYDKEFIQEPNMVRERIVDESIKFIESRRGYIKIYSEPLNEEKIVNELREVHIRHYVLGGDTASTGDDFFAGKVIDNLTKETVAQIHIQHIDEDVFGEQMYCLGKYYNNALIGIEVNWSLTPMKRVSDLGYNNVYVREHHDRYTNVIRNEMGVWTDRKSKPIMIDILKRLMREDASIECDEQTLREMLTYIKNDQGGYEAQEGYHDDLVMATAIAHYISPQQMILDKIERDEPVSVIEQNFNINQNQTEGGLIEW